MVLLEELSDNLQVMDSGICLMMGGGWLEEVCISKNKQDLNRKYQLRAKNYFRIKPMEKCNISNTDWFNNIENKQSCTFIQLDIKDFYPSITETILDNAISLA